MGENQPNTCLGLLGLPALIKLGLDPGCSLTCLGVLPPPWASVSLPQLCVPDTGLEDLLAEQTRRVVAGICTQHCRLTVAVPSATIPSLLCIPRAEGTVRYPQWDVQPSTQDALGMLELGCCSLSPHGFPSISVSSLKKSPFRPLAHLKHWVKRLLAWLDLRQLSQMASASLCNRT